MKKFIIYSVLFHLISLIVFVFIFFSKSCDRDYDQARTIDVSFFGSSEKNKKPILPVHQNRKQLSKPKIIKLNKDFNKQTKLKKVRNNKKIIQKERHQTKKRHKFEKKTMFRQKQHQKNEAKQGQNMASVSMHNTIQVNSLGKSHKQFSNKSNVVHKGKSVKKFDKKNYILMVKAQIARFKKYPLQARRRYIQGRPFLFLTIDMKGNIQQLKLQKSSGSDILDEDALQTVRRAAPFKKMPKNLSFSLGMRYFLHD